MKPTHLLDGQELVQHIDKQSRVYYTDTDNRRVSTKGRNPEPIGYDPYVGADPLPADVIETEDEEQARILAELERALDPEASDMEEEEEDSDPRALQPHAEAPPAPAKPKPPKSKPLTSIPFMGAAVAFTAAITGHGYCERGGIIANRESDEQTVTLSLPEPDGGHLKYLIRLPDVLALHAEPVE